jgi:excinuclease ABC subunit B
VAAEEAAKYETMPPAALGRVLDKLEKQMYEHARNLEFEEAARLRDKIRAIRERQFRVVAGARS